MRGKTPLGIVGMVAAAAIALTGCGDGGSAEPPGTTDYGSLAGLLKDVGAELNDYWGTQWGTGWRNAVVKVPENAASTACGTIDAVEAGPAYCDADLTMVLPLAFFRDQLVGADDAGTNDAAVAAIVGHEFGHHLQALSGLSEEITAWQEEDPDNANLLSVANELNADCTMGIWMSSVDDERRLEPGDLAEVLIILGKIGDDQLSADAGEEADATTFDHGTSEQRRVWFGVGYVEQDIEACGRVFDDLADGTLAEELQAGADAANARG